MTRRAFDKSTIQQDIINRIIDGWTNKQIAKQLNYSESAIAYHLTKLFKKYKARNRQELILKIMKICYSYKNIIGK